MPRRLSFRRSYHFQLIRLNVEADLIDFAQSLLSSIHTHASHLLAKSHLLLPILTPEAPYLPAPILAHIDDFRLSIDAIDERKGFRGNTVAKEWDKTARVDLAKDAHLYGWKGEGWKAGDGRLAVTTKAKGWRDVEKKWEGSALIAIGALIHFRWRDEG